MGKTPAALLVEPDLGAVDVEPQEIAVVPRGVLCWGANDLGQLGNGESGSTEANPTPEVKFRLATGNVGVMAAQNEEVKAKELPILAYLFLAIGVIVAPS